MDRKDDDDNDDGIHLALGGVVVVIHLCVGGGLIGYLVPV